MSQLAVVFDEDRIHPTPDGMAGAGWKSISQYYYDARSFHDGEDIDLTDEQIRYIQITTRRPGSSSGQG